MVSLSQYCLVMKDFFEQFVSRTVENLKADSRFLGLAIAGSWVRDEIDEFSDLDLIVVCENDFVPDLPGMQSVARRLGTLISSFTGEHVGEPTLLICLFDIESLVHVDLKFATRDELEKRPYNPTVVWERESAVSEVISTTEATPISPDAQWIEDRFWTWVHYAALRIGRAELFRPSCLPWGIFESRFLGRWRFMLRVFRRLEFAKSSDTYPSFGLRLEKKPSPAYDLQSCYFATLASIENLPGA